MYDREFAGVRTEAPIGGKDCGRRRATREPAAPPVCLARPAKSFGFNAPSLRTIRSIAPLRVPPPRPADRLFLDRLDYTGIGLTFIANAAVHPSSMSSRTELLRALDFALIGFILAFFSR